MKPLTILLVALITFSCSNDDEYPKYSISNVSFVPDSLLEKRRVWIINTVEAATNNLSTEDYERPENMISKVNEVSFDLFKKPSIGLKEKGENYTRFIHTSEMTPKEFYIFDSLKSINNENK